MADQYTTERIAELVRIELDDVVSPYLVSDDSLAEAIHAAQQEHAERTLCLPDALVIDVEAGTHTYTVDPLPVRYREGYLATAKSFVRFVTFGELSMELYTSDYGPPRSDWRTATGTPQFAVTDMLVGQIRLSPIPVIDDTLDALIYRYPDPIEDLSSALEIPDHLRRSLVNGTLARICRIQDSELFNPQKAALYDALWRQQLLEDAAKVERHTRKPGNVRISRRGVW